MSDTDTGREIPPKTVIGDYRVVTRIASGGMGDVYEVVNPLMQEFYAMKVLREGEDPDARQESVRRFFDEGRITARLRHSNIVTLHTMGVEPYSGRFYFIMDYVGLSPARYAEVMGKGPWFSRRSSDSGGTKGAVGRRPLTLEDVFRVKGPLDEDVLRVLAADVARGLYTAHTFESGVVHCDIKPANILIREDGHAVVSDFGVARVRSFEDAGSGVLLGTPDYMAPEQRVPDGRLTPKTDIYAFGVMICRLLTGAFPVGVWTRPSRLGLNPAWDCLIERCVAPSPRDRWASMREILFYLHRLPQIAAQIRHRHRIRRVLAAVGGTAALVAAVALGICVVPDGDELTWMPAVCDAAAFRGNDTAAAQPNPEWAGPLVYGADAPAILPKPDAQMPHVPVIVLPKHVEDLADGFAAAFPRLAYVVCEEGNPILFAKDGILYSRRQPGCPLLVPPRLFGTIRLPGSVSEFSHPWPDAVTTATTLIRKGRGAYGRDLTVVADRPVVWRSP